MLGVITIKEAKLGLFESKQKNIYKVFAINIKPSLA